MFCMNSDNSANNKTNPFDSVSAEQENFFLQPENITAPHSASVLRRLNDYDNNILQKEAYRDIKNEVFKLEYKIAKTEEELKFIESQIQAANDIHDFETSEALFVRYKQLKYELSDLTNLYNETSLSARISGEITSIFSPKFMNHFKGIKRFFEMIESKIIEKLPQKLASSIELKKTLDKLKTINKNVDELMTLQTPYGEAGSKYIQLSKYITKANSIHSKISKSLK